MTIKEETLHSNIETVNSKQLAVLKKHFPQCFDKSENFIQEKMLEVVNANEVELSKESYTLNWLGKSYARLLTNLPPKTLINEDTAHNQLEQNKNSKNLLIKGDNLEVLKHMVNAYSEKVKMIYIDPPYNTGSDGFVYNDDRKFTKEQLMDLAGVDFDEASRILEFTDKGSSSHSAWLTFMYPRLYIAKELLQEDGVICISIDENEVNQLKLLCDEIFGESNFCSQFVVKSNPRGSQSNNFSASQHEYVICYARAAYKAKEFRVSLGSSMEAEYNLTDEGGRYRLLGLRLRGGSWRREQRPLLHYPIYITQDGELSLNNNSGEVIFPIKPTTEEDGTWRWSKDKFTKDKHLLVAKKVKRNSSEVWDIFTKDYLNSSESGSQKGTKPKSILDGPEMNYQNGTNELKDLFSGNNPFPFPKPTTLVKKLIEMVTDSTSCTVLDFFSGSGTTAHSVFSFNIDNDTNHRFISIQLNEKNKLAEKYGYETIFDITKARIIKASEKISKENPEHQGDLGFKIFETIKDFRVEDDKELSLMTMTMFDDVMLTDEQYHTLLTTWRLYDGSDLTTPVRDIDLDNYTAHLCDNRLYMIASDFSSDALKALLSKLDTDKEFSPNKIVFFGKNFDSVKQMELNEALKSYANKKSLEIALVGRN